MTFNESTTFYNNREKHNVKSLKSIFESKDVSLLIGNSVKNCDHSFKLSGRPYINTSLECRAYGVLFSQLVQVKVT